MADIFLPEIESTEDQDYFLGLFVNPLSENGERDLANECQSRLPDPESKVKENENLKHSEDNKSNEGKELIVTQKTLLSQNSSKDAVVNQATYEQIQDDLYFDIEKEFARFKMDIWTSDDNENSNQCTAEISNNQNDTKNTEIDVDENVNSCLESNSDGKIDQSNESKEVDSVFVETEMNDETVETNKDEEDSKDQESNEAEMDSKDNESKEDSKEEINSELNIDIEDMFNFPPPSVSQLLSDLEGLADSEYIHHRQLAVKKILDSLQKAGTNQEHLQLVISVMCKLSEDEESMVRSELVQHIPSIALFCQGHSADLKRVIRQQLVPYTVKLLNDSQLGVRKLGQSALLVLLEDGLIDQSQLSEWICPLVSQLAMCVSSLEELRTEDVAVMSRMIPLVGRDMTIKFFLDPYVSLCSDTNFGIRKICAMGFGTLCRVVGPETTESSLLQAFMNLCNDTIWTVRKACAEVFVDIATTVSIKTKREVLLEVYINLLNDTSRYVKYFAYKSLGEFIYTFVVPADEEETIQTKPQSPTEPLTSENAEPLTKVPHLERQDEFRSGKEKKSRYKRKISRERIICRDSLSVAAKDDHVFLRVDNNENVFNNFQFWRVPLPEVELDIDIDGGKATNIHIRAKVPGSESSPSCASEIKVRIASDESDSSGSNEKNTSDNKISRMQIQTACINTILSSTDKQNELEDDTEVLSSSFKEAVLTFKDNHMLEVETKKIGFMEPFHTKGFSNTPYSLGFANLEDATTEIPQMTPYDQDIVPPELLCRFISAANQHFPVDDVNKQCGDEDRIEYCAYSLPAVALTLGRKNWPCIRNTCKKLAKDTKWIVRRTIAASLHELATILGEDITAQDLLPIFLDLLKDVDEVRMKLIMHLYEFLQHLQPVWRIMFLPLIDEFAKVDNERNWRFRCTVAEQLRPTLELFDSYEILKYFLPIALAYVQDKISAVRLAGMELIAVIVKRFMMEESMHVHAKSLMELFDIQHRQSNKWVWRQMYVLLCERIAKQDAMPKDVYVELIVPKLFTLAWDNVPNVRLAVSRCLAVTLLPLDYLPSIQKVNYEQLLQVMYNLQGDIDEDVRHFARLSARAFNVLPEKKLSPV